MALRLFRLADLADAIGDLTGLGHATVASMAVQAQKDLAGHSSVEFVAVSLADRQWAEDVVTRAYVRLARDPQQRIMSESLVGPDQIVKLADDAMQVEDGRELQTMSDDLRAYVSALSRSIAYLVCRWYATSDEPNRVAMSQATGETLRTVRRLPSLIEDVKAHLDSSVAAALARLEQSTQTTAKVEESTEAESVFFELDFALALTTNEADLAARISAATVAVLEGKSINIIVSMPTLDSDVKYFGDVVYQAQLKRERLSAAHRLNLVLSAFFSPQVQSAWGHYLADLASHVSVVHAIISKQDATGSKLDVWRTIPPVASAPVWLDADEVKAVVESVRLNEWDQLRGGPGWRAADELPRSVIVEKVMASILHDLTRQGLTSDASWSEKMLQLPYWHIGQG